MSHFIKSGNTYKVFAGDALDIKGELPPGNYLLKFHQFEGFYLETAPDFKIPHKVYGKNSRYAERIIQTFRGRESNTGVLLVGEKGSGKTLLARQVAIESGLPTILINSAYSGENFNSFLGSINQPCILFIDEFEKTFDSDSQEKLLTLLDGTCQYKKLFILTSNNKWRINSNMKNRPGRIFYLIEYEGLEEEFIREYCSDCLSNQDYTNTIVQISKSFDHFNFDLLSSMVEESNRYGENPEVFMGIINAKPEYSGNIAYRVQVELNGEVVSTKSISDDKVFINPSTDSFSTSVHIESESEYPSYEDTDWGVILNLLKEQKAKLYTQNEENPFGDEGYDDWFTIECCPEDILRYEGMNTTVYSPYSGVVVKLIRDKKLAKTLGKSKKEELW